MSATVTNGVFNIGIGDTSAGGDAFTYNFQDSDTAYLNVQVATKVDALCTGSNEVFETLSPRERVVASGYAINSYSVDGFTAAANASGTDDSRDRVGHTHARRRESADQCDGTNTLTLQGGAGTGAIQFFSANNYINTTTFRMAARYRPTCCRWRLRQPNRRTVDRGARPITYPSGRFRKLSSASIPPAPTMAIIWNSRIIRPRF